MIFLLTDFKARQDAMWVSEELRSAQKTPLEMVLYSERDSQLPIEAKILCMIYNQPF